MAVSLWGGLTALKKLTCVEVAPSLQMVEVRKAGGDTLEFHKTMEELVAPIAMDSHLALEGKSGKTEENAKRPAPSEVGCRIESRIF
ncbi:hypothetical protein Lser_V15G18750 [Lactuca serriola]